MKSRLVALVLASALLPSVPAAAASGDDLLAKIVTGYAEDGVTDPWDHSWRPEGANDAFEPRSSADARLGEVVALFTRDRLDAGGWVNAFVTTPGYSAGNRLSTVAIDEGALSGPAAKAAD